MRCKRAIEMIRRTQQGRVTRVRISDLDGHVEASQLTLGILGCLYGEAS